VKNKSYTVAAIVLKRINVGETDRIVNLLTQEFGKITVVAKGVRKMKSSKRAFLEPGNIIKAFCLETKSLPLLTQATLIEDCSIMKQNLSSYRSLTQLLEIFEKLFVEVELEPEIFHYAILLRRQVVAGKAPAKFVREILSKIIVQLGFQHPDESKYKNISDYIAALSDSKMKSFEFLQVKP
jgi:DNA repair protein RecO (recombination protein O)